MAPKQPKATGTSSGDWMGATAERLDWYRGAHGLVAQAVPKSIAMGAGRGSKGGGDGKGKGKSVVSEPTAGTTAKRPPGTPAWKRPWSHQTLPPTDSPTTPEDELEALRLSQHAPASFAIARKAIMICGRPTVVPGGQGVCKLPHRPLSSLADAPSVHERARMLRPPRSEAESR